MLAVAMDFAWRDKRGVAQVEASEDECKTLAHLLQHKQRQTEALREEERDELEVLRASQQDLLVAKSKLEQAEEALVAKVAPAPCTPKPSRLTALDT